MIAAYDAVDHGRVVPGDAQKQTAIGQFVEANVHLEARSDLHGR